MIYSQCCLLLWDNDESRISVYQRYCLYVQTEIPHNNNNNNIITLFKSQIILAKHKCFTNWGDCKSNKSNQIDQINQIKSNQMLVFEAERGKPEYLEKNLSEQSREPTNSVHIWRRVRESNPGHIGGRRALSPLRQPCSPLGSLGTKFSQVWVEKDRIC